MKIIITGGGTAGHVTPLLAVASELATQSPGVQVRYIGKYGDSMSTTVIEHSAIEKEYKIAAGKFRRYHGKKLHWYLTQPGILFHNLKDSVLFCIGIVQSVCLLIVWRPNVVFVKGGYVGLPVGLAAALLRIPLVTHDSDALPGLTNRLLSRYAKALAVGLPVDQYPQYATKNIIYTGVPVQDSFLHAPNAITAKHQLKIADNAQVIAIIGGSLGAVRINQAVLSIIDEIVGRNDSRYLYWVTGSKSYQTIEQKVQTLSYKDRIRILPYSDQVSIVFAAAMVVVTRAGATTLAELSVMQKPSIVIPNPLLTGGHQLINAKMLQDSGAAVVIDEPVITADPSVLPNAIDQLMSDDSARADLTRNIAKLSVPDSARRIAALLLQCAESVATKNVV